MRDRSPPRDRTARADLAPALTLLGAGSQMTSFTSSKTIAEMNSRELRARISDYLRQDFSDRLSELEQLLDEAISELERKEQHPPRSDFVDIRVLIESKNRSKYNRIQNTEAIGALWGAMKLEHVGAPDELSKACLSGPMYRGYVVLLAEATVADFPDDERRMCGHFFPSVDKFEFFVRTVQAADLPACDTTAAAATLTGRRQLHEAVLRIEAARSELVQKIKVHSKALTDALREDVETRADSGEESGGSDDDDSDSDESPLPKRRKTLDEIGTGKDTEQQKVSNFGIQLNHARAVEGLRVREFRDEGFEWHYVELLGAFSTHRRCVIEKKLPAPSAPTFSRGAEEQYVDGLFTLVPPDENPDSDTIVTLKLTDMDRETGSDLVYQYTAMHRLADAMNKAIREAVSAYTRNFELVIRAHKEGGEFTDYTVNDLSNLQKLSLGRLYLHAIAVHKAEEPEEESSDEEEGDSGSVHGSDEEEEEEESDSGSVYASDSEDEDEDAKGSSDEE